MISCFIGADRYRSDVYPIEAVFDGDFSRRHIDDDVIASTALEIYEELFDA